MHTALVRGQNVFGFFTTVAFFVAALIALSDFTHPRLPQASIVVKDISVSKTRPHYSSSKKQESASIRFNLDCDFSSLFTWNTKLIFVYVTASWPSNSSSSDHDNEAVIWDSIITNPSADHLVNIGPTAKKKLIRSAKGKSIDPSRGKINLKNQRPKYQISAPSGKMAEQENVVLKVHYNVQPWVGVLTWSRGWEFGRWERIKGGISKVFNLPALKTKEGEKKT